MNRRRALLGALALASLVVAFLWLRPKRYDTPTHEQFDAFIQGSHTYDAFVAFLAQQGVANVVEPWHLWRQGTDWRSVGEPPFAVPPREQWSGIVSTLRVVRDEVIPLTGPVEVVSGYRTEVFNQKAGGAKGSRHKWFEAVDVIPLTHWRRGALHGVLVPWWEQRGEPHKVGLGLYDGVRFHVDTWKFRAW